MREQLFEILDEMGFSFEEEEKDPARDIDLREYLSDSHLMVMFALQVEEKLGVELDETILQEDNLQSFNMLAEMISKMEPAE
ncbi:MAG: hypothetical protein IJT27_00015 [Clostridia bacterium]|nr:hypothetical protein [Clostridia bacterium]